MTAPGTAPGQAATHPLDDAVRRAVTENRDCRGSLPCGFCERRITELLAAVDDHVQAAIAAAAPAEPIVLHMDAPAPEVPYEATLIPERLAAAAAPAPQAGAVCKCPDGECGHRKPQPAPERIIVSPGDGSAIGSLLAHVMGTSAEHQPQAAPELGATMAETNRYRQALENVFAVLDRQTLTFAERISRARTLIRTAREGK